MQWIVNNPIMETWIKYGTNSLHCRWRFYSLYCWLCWKSCVYCTTTHQPLVPLPLSSFLHPSPPPTFFLVSVRSTFILKKSRGKPVYVLICAQFEDGGPRTTQLQQLPFHTRCRYPFNHCCTDIPKSADYQCSFMCTNCFQE